MRPCLCLFASLSLFVASLAAAESDRQEIIGDSTGIKFNGDSGSFLLSGENSQLLAIEEDGRIPAALGFWKDDPQRSRVLVFGHDSMLNADPKLLSRAAKWCGRGKTAGRLYCHDGLAEAAKNAGLSECGEMPGGFCLIQQDGLNHEATLLDVKTRLERGEGLIVLCTVWALDEKSRKTLDSLLADAGLRLSADISSNDKPLAFPNHSNPLHSIPKAAAALAAGKLGEKERLLACRSVEESLALDNPPPILAKLIQDQRQKWGWIAPSAEKPWKMGLDPVADILLNQERLELDKISPEKLFVHSAAAAFPGLCAEGKSQPQTRRFRAASPANTTLQNCVEQGTWIETGLYAPAGQVVTVKIPAALAGKGLELMIGIHEDQLWRAENAKEELRRFPSIVRNFKLELNETKLGTPFGGLIRFHVEPGLDLGEVEVVLEGALEAPVYELGVTTPEQWKQARLNPGAWGYLRSSHMVSYLPRSELSKLDNPQAYAKHWDEVIRLGDEWLGFGPWRQRPETAVQDIQVSVGLHHSGYPLMLGPGDGDHLLIKPNLFRDGDWGLYHELGHGFQSCYRDEYTIATHAEVDVNLLPAIVYMKLHHRGPWDVETHSTWDGSSRLAAMKDFLALPEKDRSWTAACESPVAYDFHFGLAESFGWEIWRDALGRLGRFHDKPQEDAELAALTDGDEGQRRRDRMLVCLSGAAHADLASWFERYGLGKGEFPLGAKARETAKKSGPTWCGNRPVTAILGQAKIAAAKPGILGVYKAEDADPRDLHEFTLKSGNEDGVFDLNRSSGELRLLKPLTAPRKLVMLVRDGGVPRSSKEQEIEVAP